MSSYFSKQLKILPAPPLAFRLAKFLQSRTVPGGYRLERLLRQTGHLDVLVRYPLSERVFVDMPIGMVARDLGAREVAAYENASTACVSEIVASWGMPITLIDCGADVGLMSAKFVEACPGINYVLALEPNVQAFDFLQHNLSNLPVPSTALRCGGADYHGRANLSHDHFDQGDHAAFLEKSEDGQVEVVRLDDLDFPRGSGLVLKVDVEGGELAVLRGAARTLTQFQRILVLFEAHPRHVERTRISPLDIIAFICGMRPCNVRICEEPQLHLDVERPFYDQVPSDKILNICVYTP